MDDKYVIEHIKELCKQRNISYYKLAKLSKIPYSSLNSMINKSHVPSINSLIKICDGLGITLSQFFSDITDNLASEQKELLSLWNLLDKESQLFIKGYMYGLSGKKPPLNSNTGDDTI